MEEARTKKKTLKDIKEIQKYVKDSLKEKSLTFEEIYVDQATILTEGLKNQELTKQAKRNVKSVIKQIYRKSKDKFNLKATSMMD